MRVIPKVKTASKHALLADFTWDFFSILHRVRTWLQVIFTCSHTWSSFWTACTWVAMKMVKDWFSGLVADFYNAGIQKLVTQYDKCLNLHGDYVGKWFKIYSNDVKCFYFHFFFCNHRMVFTFWTTYVVPIDIYLIGLGKGALCYFCLLGGYLL
jgi:hypothetical protein